MSQRFKRSYRTVKRHARKTLEKQGHKLRAFQTPYVSTEYGLHSTGGRCEKCRLDLVFWWYRDIYEQEASGMLWCIGDVIANECGSGRHSNACRPSECNYEAE